VHVDEQFPVKDSKERQNTDAGLRSLYSGPRHHWKISRGDGEEKS